MFSKQQNVGAFEVLFPRKNLSPLPFADVLQLLPLPAAARTPAQADSQMQAAWPAMREPS